MVKEKKLEILAVRGNFSAERSVCIPREHSERKSIHHEEIFDPGAVGAADDGPADRLRRQDYTAASILQDRVDAQAEGGAWYPESMETWSNAQVVQNGTYVAMIATADHQEEIAEQFNALFA